MGGGRSPRAASPADLADFAVEHSAARYEAELLQIGGVDCGELAAHYGTPIFVTDLDWVERRCRQFWAALETLDLDVTCHYAAKANSTPDVLETVLRAGLSVEVASEWELERAVRAGFTAPQIIVHGNAKSDGFLRASIDLGVSAIVLDSYGELGRVARMAIACGSAASIMPRVRLLGAAGSVWDVGASPKFGMSEAEASEVIALAGAGMAGVRVVGVHFHAGSQLRDLTAITGSMAACASLSRLLDAATSGMWRMDIGGGFPVSYWPDDREADQPGLTASCTAAEVAECVSEGLRALAEAGGAAPASLVVEPGRWLVAGSTVTLATVRSVKRAPEGVAVVALDAGCNTLPDCWTYRWRFPVLPTRAGDAGVEETLLCGPLCDTGDVLVPGAALPVMHVDDTIGLLQTGAYQIEQQSNFNAFPTADVVCCSGGRTWVAAAGRTLTGGMSIPTQEG